MAAPVIRTALTTTILIAGTFGASPVLPQEVPPPAYQIAAQRAGVPSPVLYAIALQESGIRKGGRVVPWPWTLNVSGAGRRFDTKAAACAGLQQAIREAPLTRVDVGLGQINLGYQQHRYDHPCDLLDPYRNLVIAAEILKEQHNPGEEWMLAIGRYHRPAGGPPAARYRRSVGQHLARVLGVPVKRRD
ncbi:transglycosylase SLT domain-containing protein [Shinella sp.]|uniref:transglycosylase SLT domain-containing protein n=1 Tax=Shinella sp. TaxID=1870904 RepID=UPI0025883852|nr:transglycosylase SLT domain-containing protein [Shinella sp.]MCW5712327.1 transglycosylase SLT domain-containing protein [Shinella sp.]